MRVHGVDFSGSAEPGEDIWLVSGWYPADDEPFDPDAEPDDLLTDGGGTAAGDSLDFRVTDARPASEAFGASSRSTVLSGLLRFLWGEHEGATDLQVTGLDCSLGLPRAVLPDEVAATDDWRAALDWVRDRFLGDDARTFQSVLKDRARASDADGVELKRATDGPVGASSPYSFITRHQTLHGLRDLLWHAIDQDAVVVPPMVHPRVVECPSVVEVYPAGTLRDLGLPDRRYKDDRKYPEARSRREQILDGLLDRGVTLDGVPRERLLADSGGDALDALVGAVAVARNLPRNFAVDETRYDPVEGYIYL